MSSTACGHGQWRLFIITNKGEDTQVCHGCEPSAACVSPKCLTAREIYDYNHRLLRGVQARIGARNLGKNPRI